MFTKIFLKQTLINNVIKKIYLLFLLLFPFIVQATSIEQYIFSQKQDIIKELPQNNFVICDKCPKKEKLTIKTNLKQTPFPFIIKVTENSQPDIKGQITTPTITQPKILIIPPTIKPKFEQTKLEQKIDKIYIYFDINKSDLKPQEKQKIDDNIETIKQKDISIKGYTCSIGTKSYNNKLAEKRAKNIANYLKEKNVYRIKEVTGQGKCCYISNDKALNRRVEIIFLNQGGFDEKNR